MAAPVALAALAVCGNGGAAGVPTAGAANTGSGGGGEGNNLTVSGAAGGSGVVIVRYWGNARATGGAITSSGGYTIHTFTSNGTLALV